MQDPRVTKDGFARRLVAAMKAKGIGALALSRMTASLGHPLHEMTIRQWMAGKCQPRRIDRAILIAKCLGVSVDWLCYGQLTAVDITEQNETATISEDKR